MTRVNLSCVNDTIVNVLRRTMADVTVEEQRTVIKFYVKVEKSLKETNGDLWIVYGYLA